MTKQPIYLFSQEQFDNAKSRDKLPSKCNCCGNTFHKTKNQIQADKKNNLKNQTTYGLYCSVKCLNKSRTEKGNVIMVCDGCGEKLSRNISQFKRSHKRFCSQSCFAKINNKIRNYNPRTAPTKKVNCKDCNTEIEIHRHSSGINLSCKTCLSKIDPNWIENIRKQLAWLHEDAMQYAMQEMNKKDIF